MITFLDFRDLMRMSGREVVAQMQGGKVICAERERKKDGERESVCVCVRVRERERGVKSHEC